MIDDHCHPFATHGGPIDLSAISLDTLSDPGATQRRRTDSRWKTSTELMTVRLAKRLDCEPEDVAEARARASRDWARYTAALFRDAMLDELIMDTDYPPGAEAELPTYANLAGCPVHRIMRLDPTVDAAIGRGATAKEVARALEDAMRAGAKTGVVGFKTLPSYRTGLAVAPEVSEREADESLAEPLPLPRRAKACRDWVLRRALGVAAELGLPILIHSGFGDPDTRLKDANPLLLEDILRTPEGAAAKIVIMVAYPWHEELAFLVTTKPNVHADLSMFNIYCPATYADRLLRTLDLAPASKIMLGTDGYGEPEVYWFGALVLRDAWHQVSGALLRLGCRDAWLSDVARMLFNDNAKRLYGL
jgi:uncharacterized protein